MRPFPAARVERRRAPDLYVRRRGRRLFCGKAGAGGDGQEDRALRQGRQRPGGENLQQHDPRHFHDRRFRSFRAGRKTRPFASGAVRCRLHLFRAVLVAHHLLPGAGAGADIARQQGLPARICGGLDAEGSEAFTGGGQWSRGFHPLGAAAAVLYENFVGEGSGGRDFSAIVEMLRGDEA